MESNTSATGRPDPFRLFDEKSQSGFGFGSGFLENPEKPLPPPPSVEVLPSQVLSLSILLILFAYRKLI